MSFPSVDVDLWYLGLIEASRKIPFLPPASDVLERLRLAAIEPRTGPGIVDSSVKIRMTALRLLHRTTAGRHERQLRAECRDQTSDRYWHIFPV